MTRDEYRQAVAEFFDHRQDYNKDNFHARLAERLVSVANPQVGERVLDAATGTGLVAVPVARLVGVSGRVVAADISAGMLGQAARAVAAARLENVELLLTDASTLNLSPSSFDLVTCGSAVPFLADIPAALRHWHRLLRPGGRVAFNCWSEASYVSGYLIQQAARRHGVELPLGSSTGTPERCEALLVEAGFARPAVKVEPDGRFVPLDEMDRGWDRTLRNPLAHPLQAIGPDTLARVRDDYEALVSARATDRGVWDEMTAYYVTAFRD